MKYLFTVIPTLVALVFVASALYLMVLLRETAVENREEKRERYAEIARDCAKFPPDFEAQYYCEQIARDHYRLLETK